MSLHPYTLGKNTAGGLEGLQRKPSRILDATTEALFSVFCAAPSLLLVSFIFFVLRAMSAIGRVPMIANPDPKSLGMHVHQAVIYLFTGLSLASFLLVPAAALGLRRLGHALPVRRLLIFILSCILLSLLVIADPGGLILWFLD